ncbi:MAG: hypothetical protein GY795_14190 [Desulfobacterales bacterium]|nr:hypothetical protein [Desulfobacterales bacterium]
MVIIIICIVIVFGGFFYYLAVRSRKTYRCPECGESVRVEHMETARCGMCGSLLEEKEIRK